MSGLYADIDGATARCRAAKQAVEDFGGTARACKVEVDLRRPPEQARRRRPTSRGNGSTATASTWSSTCRPRRVALAVQRGRAGEEQGLPRHRRRRRRDLTGEQCSPEHGALDLRHLHAGEVDRRRDGEDRRRQLVLPHRRLRLRPCAASATPRRSCKEPGGKVLGAVALSVPGHHRLLLLPAAGAGEPAPRCSAWRMPAADTVNCDQAGARVRPQPGDEARRRC